MLDAVFSILLLAASPSPIHFAPTLEAIADEHPDDPRPRVVIFGAEWCGWCRKLESETLASTAVEEAAPAYLWVKVDVDREEQLAARYGVDSLPQTLLLDATGRVLGQKPGYLTPDVFLEFLTNSVQSAAQAREKLDELLQRLQGNDEAARVAAVGELIESVMRADREARSESLELLDMADVNVQGAMVAHLADPLLAHRSAAYGLLMQASNAGLPFDPFAAQAQRDGQIAKWKEWIASQGGSTPEVPLTSPSAASPWSREDGDRPPPPPMASPLTPEAAGESAS